MDPTCLSDYFLSALVSISTFNLHPSSEFSTRFPRRRSIFSAASLFSIKRILLLRIPCPLRNHCVKAHSSVLAGTPRHPQLQVPDQVSLFLHRTVSTSPLPLPRLAYLRSAPGPRDPKMKMRPPTAQRRPTPSWQPPPPQRPLFQSGSSSSRNRIFPTSLHRARVLRATFPPPPGPLSDTSSWLRDRLRAAPFSRHGGMQLPSRTPSTTLTALRRDTFPFHKGPGSSGRPGLRVRTKPHLKENGGMDSLGEAAPLPLLLSHSLFIAQPHRSALGGQGKSGTAHASDLLRVHPLYWKKQRSQSRSYR